MEENKSQSTPTRVSGKAIYKWSAADRILNSLMTFSGNIVLARLLDPSDFGLVAMVAIFLAVAQNLSSCGMSDGLVQKPRPTEHDYSTVFVFNAFFGLFFAVLFTAISAPLASFYNRPQIEGIMIVAGICFFFQTLSFAQETRMRKELDMKKLAIVRLSSTASATALGIVMACTGFGYWALVATHSGLSVFTFLYYIIVSRWMPKIAFYKESFKEMFSYGFHLMLAYVVTQIGRNINTSILGKFNTPAVSGLYSQAQKLEEVPFGITESIFNWPFFTVLSNQQDYSERRKLASNMHLRLWVITLAVGALLYLVSAPAFNLLYGAKWDGAIPVFRLLLVFGVCATMKNFYQTAFKAYGRPKLVRNLSVAEVVLQLVLLSIFLKSGLILIASTQVVAAAVIMIVHSIYYSSITEIRYKTIVKEFFTALIVPVMSLLISLPVVSIWQGLVSAFVNCVSFVAVFATVTILLCELIKPSYYAPLRAEVIAKIKNFLHKKQI